MAKKEFKYRGKTVDELKSLSLKEFAKLVKSRSRRSLLRGMTEQEKILLENIRQGKKNIKTHCRDMVIVPEMVNSTLLVHNGKSFVAVAVKPEMLGYRLGDFALTRKALSHSAPGVGATKSSASTPVK